MDAERQVVDFHTHTFPTAIADRALAQLRANCHTQTFTDGTQTSLTASMRAAGIGLSVIQPVATHPRQVVKINDSAMAINEHTAETGLLSFGCIHPDDEDWHAELGRIKEAGIRGIKLHPVFQGVDIDDARYLRILNRAAELGLTVLTHAGQDVGFPGVVHCSPRMILHAVREVGPVRLILAHMGGWRDWDEALDLLPATGAYIDTSFSLGSMTPNGDGYYQSASELRLLDEPAFVRLVRAFGAERVLFGSDSPWMAQDQALAAIRRLPLTEGERGLILWKNAERLLHIAPCGD